MQDNDRTLGQYEHRTAAQLLHLLADLLGRTFVEMRHVEQGRQDAVCKSADLKSQTDTLLSSPAMKTLLTIQAADRLALRSASDNEKLAFWLENFEAEAAAWRSGVDDVLGDQMELLRQEELEEAAAKAKLKAETEGRIESVNEQTRQQLAGRHGGRGERCYPVKQVQNTA